VNINSFLIKCLSALLFTLSTAVWAGDFTLFRTARVPVNGVVVVAHGLNVAPSKMGYPDDKGSIVNALLEGGYHVVLTALTGHTGSIEAMKSVTAEAWLSDARLCFLAACAEAAKVEAVNLSHCPVYLVGFSLGALVFEVLMNDIVPIGSARSVVFDKAVLFSPAVALKFFARFVLALGISPEGNGRIVASGSPVEYRAQAGASIAAYKALFLLEDRLVSSSFAKNNIPTLVFIDPMDELVSYVKLKKLIKKFDLTEWGLEVISNKGASIRPAYHHLIIDDACMNKETWLFVCRVMLDFLVMR
jgi:esterase/lipase